MQTYCLTVTCPARRGIVAGVTGFLAANECNIVHSSQYDDTDTEQFFMRISFVSEGGKSLELLSQGFNEVAEEFGIQFRLYDESQKMKVLLMVSRFGHCLNDLLYRVKVGSLPIEIVGVVSNHLDHQKLVINSDIPFHYVKVEKNNKPFAEQKVADIFEESGAELIVLARYMQILSDSFCQQFSGRIINIHHSFLPSFKGANPYKQAYNRGVKLIGATSHYVTADLDEGPIIEQDIARVTHVQNVADYVAIGRDVESQVLARAIHAHAERRVFLDENKTIVFPASPGSFSADNVG